MATKAPSESERPWWASARFWLGILTSAAAVYLALRGVRWAEVAAALSSANVLLVLLSLGLVLVTNWVKGMRWRLLLHPLERRVPVGRCVSVLYAGQLANAVLPLRLGEVVRAYLIGDIEGVGRVFAFATIVVEKAFDSVMLLLLFAVLAPFVPLPLWSRGSSLVASGLLAVLLVLLIVVTSQQRRISGLLELWADSRPHLGILRSVQRVVEASAKLSALRDAPFLLRLWGWSGIIWLLGVVNNQVMLWAVHLAPGPLAAPLVLAVVTTGTILPTSLLQIGVFHYLCILTLGMFGVEQHAALTYALLLHSVVYVPMVAGGVLGLWSENCDLHRLAGSLTERST
jgi:uncharacterized protein (TIRG00374 family)